MPIDPGKGERHAATVVDLIRQAEAAMLRLLADHLTRGVDLDTQAWAAARYADLAEIRRRVTRIAALTDRHLSKAIEDAITRAYVDGMAWATRDIDSIVGVSTYRPGGLDETAYARAAAGRTIQATRGALAMVPSLLGAAYSEAVAAGALEVLGGGATRLQASQHVLDRLLGEGIKGFQDRAGRNWSLDTYVEMAVRTTTGQAAVDGHNAQVQAAGLDLVIVSDSPRECPLCRPWERKILSLSGRVGMVVEQDVATGESRTVMVAGTVAEARAAGLQHPNCTHALQAYLPGVTAKPAPQADPQGYEDKQRQRAIERSIREWKRREAIALTPDAQARARRKIRAWQAEARRHSAETGTKRLNRREQVGRGVVLAR